MIVILSNIRKHALVRLFLAIVLSVTMAFLVGTGFHSTPTAATIDSTPQPAAIAKTTTSNSSTDVLGKALQNMRAAKSNPASANAARSGSASGLTNTQSQQSKDTSNNTTTPDRAAKK